MKRFFVLLGILTMLCVAPSAWAGIVIDEDLFPDEVFREYLQNEVDPNQDGILTPDEIAGIKSIQCFYMGIKDLEGIQYFDALTELECFGNELTSLDVSKNTELTYLNCYRNHLSSLDVSALSKLTRLICSDNEFTTLNLSSNPALTSLRCYEGKLTKLDISKNPLLEEVKIYSNNISSLDVSSNHELRVLELYGNPLTTLDLNKCPYLSKAVRNGIKDSNINGGSVCSYTDAGTNSELIVDKTVTVKAGAETAATPDPKDSEPGNGSSEDSGMGGIASPEANANYYTGSSVLVDFYPTGSIVLGNISYSGTCQVLLGNSVKLEKTFSGTGAINSPVRHIQYYFTPDAAGTYTVEINCSYTLSGVSVSSSRHTRSFRVTDPNVNDPAGNDSPSDDSEGTAQEEKDTSGEEGGPPVHFTYPKNNEQVLLGEKVDVQYLVGMTAANGQTYCQITIEDPKGEKTTAFSSDSVRNGYQANIDFTPSVEGTYKITGVAGSYMDMKMGGSGILLGRVRTPYITETLRVVAVKTLPAAAEPANPAKTDDTTTPGKTDDAAAPKNPDDDTESTEKESVAKAEAADKNSVKNIAAKITSRKSDSDLKGSTFAPLKLKASKTAGTSVTLTWSKVSGAKGYMIYGSLSGKSNKLIRLADTGKTKLVVKKIGSKKLQKGKTYKFLAVAWKTENGYRKCLSASKIIHASTTGGSLTNVKQVKPKETKKTLKKGKTWTIKASVVKKDSKKSLKKVLGLRYESSNKAIAAVSAKGKVTAKKAGKATIFVYAQNGVCAKVVVTVKAK